MKIKFAVFFIFLFTVLPFWADDAFLEQGTVGGDRDISEGGVTVETVNDRILKQKISWEGDENALEYKVEIRDKLTDTPHFYKTSNTYILFSLPPGDYRFRVTIYDFFGREAIESSWMDFTISKAYQPKIEQVQTEVKTVKKVGKNVELPVHLEDIPEDAKIVMVNTKDNNEIPVEFEVEYKDEQDGEGVVNKITVPKLPAGDWKIIVTNPGGKTTESEIIRVEKENVSYNLKNINVQVFGGVTYWIPNHEIFEYQTDSENKPLEMGLRLSCLPFNKGRNYWGFDLTVNHSTISSFITNNINFELQYNSLTFSFMYQFEVWKSHLYLDARAGVGVILVDKQGSISGLTQILYDELCAYIHGKAGLYIMFKPTRFINLEAGIEYTGFFADSDYINFYVPVLNLGLSF